ncbi:MAG: hypothetical protein QW738_08190 [Nitrososphaeria archaeon]
MHGVIRLIFSLLGILSTFIFLIVSPILTIKIIFSILMIIPLLKLAKIGIDLCFKPKVHKLSVREIQYRVYKALNIRNFFICLSGIDGAGKTTQAILLLNFFKKKGLKAKIIYGRWPAFTSYFVLAIGKFLGFHRKEIEASGLIRSIPNYQCFPVLAKLYILLMLIDYSIFHLKLKIFPHVNIIILDRAIPDIVADLIYETGYYKLLSGGILFKIASSFIRSINMLIILDLPPQVAYARKLDASPNELAFKRTIYRFLIQKYTIPIIFADESKCKVAQSIQKIFLLYIKNQIA